MSITQKWFLAPVCCLLLFCSSVWANQPDPEREHEARYNINEASYLIEVGKYMEALENYQTALELSTIPKTRIDALLSKATLLSSFLDASEEALKVYQQISMAYPQAAEIGRYREGLLLFQLNRPNEAKSVINNYLKTYPDGKFRFQAEALMEQIQKEEVKPPPPKPPVTPPPVEPPPPPPEVKTPEARPAKKMIPPPEVRVRLCKTTGSATISGTNVCTQTLGCGSNFKVQMAGDTLRINGSRYTQSEILFESQNPIVVTCENEKKKVRGSIQAKLSKGKLYIINNVAIEHYLRSVVPSESYASWPLETLKAQAVAARTYAYYQLMHRKTWSYDLVDDQGDQAYKGMKRETRKTDQAVRETKGQIMTHQEKPILAMYSANSGGYTADADAIFGLGKPYLVAQKDPESLKGKMARWKKRFSVSEVESALNRRGLRIKGLEGLEPAEKGPSGRIVKVRIIASSGSKVVRTRTSLRRALKLPEILLEIKKEDGDFIFDGKGWGHGVGYSQWGSAILGKKEHYDKILAFYYPKADLVIKW